MSRFCMYCGKELEKNKQCSCPRSIRAREMREQGKEFAPKKYNNGNVRPKRLRRVKKTRLPKPEKRSFIKEFFILVREFIKNPINTVTNPGKVNAGKSIILITVQGIVLSLMVYFSKSGISDAVLEKTVGTAAEGKAGILMLNMLAFIVFSYASFFVISGIFALIQKFALKLHTDFWDVAGKFALSGIPLTISGIPCIPLMRFLPPAAAVLMAGAVLVSSAVNYEAVKNMWHGLIEDRTVYIMSMAYMLYFAICISLVVSLAG